MDPLELILVSLKSFCKEFETVREELMVMFLSEYRPSSDVANKIFEE